MPLFDPAPVLPALSETLTGPADRLEPSPVTVLSAGTVAGSMPDRPSSASQWTTTSSLYQPAALEPVVGSPVSTGAVRSMLMSLTVVWLELPALSWATPSTHWPA